MVIYEEEHQALTDVCERLMRDALAKAIFIVDADGQLITGTGETVGIDTTGLASLVAGSTAATGGLAQMLGEEEFPVLFYEGSGTHLLVSVVGDLNLVIIFDERSSLGLVRLRVKRTNSDMQNIVTKLEAKARSGKGPATRDIFGEITDDDIDSLFNDTF